MATVKQRKTRSRRIKERAERRRAELWPEVSDQDIWNRNESDGYSTVPRILTLASTIADMLAAKNQRVSTTYLGLWCRVWDTGVVFVENEYELATEAGFSGERRIYTWRDRIKQLATLGFIDVKEGPKGPHQYILLRNPFHVVYDHNVKGNIQSSYWLAFIERAEEVGARDIAEYETLLKEKSSKKKAKPKKAKPKKEK